MAAATSTAILRGPIKHIVKTAGEQTLARLSSTLTCQLPISETVLLMIVFTVAQIIHRMNTTSSVYVHVILY